MSDIEILSLVVTIVALVSLSFVFTFLFRNYFMGIVESVEGGEEDSELILEEAEGLREKTLSQKLLHWTGKGFSYLILLVLVGAFGISLATRIMGPDLAIGGMTPLVIVSGSMSYKNENNPYCQDFDNQFNTYDIIFVTPYEDPYDIAMYDVVAYIGRTGATVVHRVIEIQDTEDGPVFVTQGDANSVTDANSYYGDYLPWTEIVGRYDGTRIPAVGAFVLFLQSGAGAVCIISIVYCFFVFEHYRRRLDKAIEKRSEQLLAAIPFDKEVSESDLNFVEILTYKGNEYRFINGDLPELPKDNDGDGDPPPDEGEEKKENEVGAVEAVPDEGETQKEEKE